jgi:hypothetical protein
MYICGAYMLDAANTVTFFIIDLYILKDTQQNKMQICSLWVFVIYCIVVLHICNELVHIVFYCIA